MLWVGRGRGVICALGRGDWAADVSFTGTMMEESSFTDLSCLYSLDSSMGDGWSYGHVVVDGLGVPFCYM